MMELPPLSALTEAMGGVSGSLGSNIIDSLLPVETS